MHSIGSCQEGGSVPGEDQFASAQIKLAFGGVFSICKYNNCTVERNEWAFCLSTKQISLFQKWHPVAILICATCGQHKGQRSAKYLYRKWHLSQPWDCYENESQAKLYNARRCLWMTNTLTSSSWNNAKDPSVANSYMRGILNSPQQKGEKVCMQLFRPNEPVQTSWWTIVHCDGNEC